MAGAQEEAAAAQGQAPDKWAESVATLAAAAAVAGLVMTQGSPVGTAEPDA